MYVQCGYAAVQDSSISSEIAYKIQSARKGTKKNVYMQKKNADCSALSFKFAKGVRYKFRG